MPLAWKVPLIGSMLVLSASSSGLSAATSLATWSLMAPGVTAPASACTAAASFDGSPLGDSCATTTVVSGVTLVVPLAVLAVVL
ncbi:hypothetical protein D3C72_1866700 [compost metagenome]